MQLMHKGKCWDRERQSKSYLRLKGRGEEQQRKKNELMLNLGSLKSVFQRGRKEGRRANHSGSMSC